MYIKRSLPSNLKCIIRYKDCIFQCRHLVLMWFPYYHVSFQYNNISQHYFISRMIYGRSNKLELDILLIFCFKLCLKIWSQHFGSGKPHTYADNLQITTEMFWFCDLFPLAVGGGGGACNTNEQLHFSYVGTHSGNAGFF